MIEDNADIADGLAENLVIEGYEVRVERTGRDGLIATQSWDPNLVILDLMLPDIDGYAVLKSVRTGHATMPVLILSARDQELDRLKGFRLGADDYMVKPFGLLELLARVAAVLRRSGLGVLSTREDDLRFGNLRIQRKARRVYRDGREIALRARAFDLLLALADRPDEVVTRATLLAEVWGYGEDVETRTVDWHISELRRALGDDPVRPVLIQTVRSVGYRFVPAD
ncbi:MAG: response regulator transcription factor [Gemmatimonadales bacterium]